MNAWLGGFALHLFVYVFELYTAALLYQTLIQTAAHHVREYSAQRAHV